MTDVHYLSLPLLEVDGRQMPQTGASGGDALMGSLMEDLLQVSVEESLHLPGMFTLVIKNDYFPGRTTAKDQLWKYDSLFQIGKTVKIGFSSSTTEAPEFSEQEEVPVLLEGEITAIEAHFTPDSQAPVIVRGYDVFHRLHRGRYNRSFQNMTDSDIVSTIAGELGIRADVSSSRIVHDYVFQENQTNMAFLRERAARLGYELFVQNGTLYFREPRQDSRLELKWLVDLHSFRVRANSAEQVDSVEVRGWDYSRKAAIVSTRSQANAVITDTDNGKGKSTSDKFGSTPKMVVVDQPVFSSSESDAIAQSLYNELSGEYVAADASAEGDPEIRPGKVIQLSGMGRYSGKYYVTETRHCYEGRHYTTEFNVRGLRGGSLLELLAPKSGNHPGHTLMVGIVTNNNDPEGWGRVRVKLPTLTEEHESNWARVVAIGAGSSRGFDCLPEVNDEVLVGFEHGNIHRPYVLGGVWNGRDATCEPVQNSVMDGKVRLRTFKTRVGHQLQLVEEDKGSSKKGVYLETAGGHQVYLNESERFIEVKTAGGHKIRLDDQNRNITMQSSGGHSVKLDDSGRSLKLSSVGSLTLEAATSMNLRASGNVTVQGAMIRLN